MTFHFPPSLSSFPLSPLEPPSSHSHLNAPAVIGSTRHLRMIPAMSALYVLEKQPHIPQLQLYVNAPADHTALSIHEQSITLRINPPTAHNTHNDNIKTAQQQTIVIPLDCRVKMKQPSASASASTPDQPPTAASLSINKASNACLIRVPLHRAYTDATSSLTPTLPSALELQPTSYPALYCRHCLNPLLTAPPERVKALPSSHWSELTDLWYCHNTNDNSHLDALIRHAVKAKEQTLLVGREEVRVSGSGVRGVVVAEEVVREEKRQRSRQQCGHAHHSNAHDEMKEERKEQETDDHSDERVIELPTLLYRQARCEQCEAELGWCVSESTSSSDRSSDGEIWLHKHRITNVLPGAEDTTMTTVHAEHPLLSALSALNVSSSSSPSSITSSSCPPTSTTLPAPEPSLFFRHYTLETYLSSQLLSLCEARCSFRFLIRPLSPSHVLNDNSGSGSGSGSRHLHIVILNIDTAITCPDTMHLSSGSDMQPVLKVAYSSCEADEQQCKGEVIELSAVDVAEVERVLQQQCEWLPVEFRHMGKQTLSYLRRSSSD